MNRINSIQIQNFKSIKDMKLEDCRRVNVFIGYPNVGKSNILEAMSMLTFIRERRRPDVLSGLVRLETLGQLFTYNNIREPAIISVNNNYTLQVKYEDEKNLTLSLSKTGEEVIYDKVFLNLNVGLENVRRGSKNDIDDFSGRYSDLKDFDVRPYKFLDEKVFDDRYSALDLKVPYGKNLFELIANSAKLQKEFSDLLDPYGLKVVIDVSNNHIKISPPIKNGVIKTLPVSLMAETLIRLMFFKTAIASNNNSVLLFEEPESHMFPPYISKLTTDIIFDDNNNQYFIATHSPFVLESFVEDLDSKDLSIFMVSLKEGATVVKRLSDEDVAEASSYGVDLFFNLESYLNNGSVDNS